MLSRPRTGKPGIELKLCTPDGRAAQHLIGKRDKAAFARARRVGWGDVWD